MIKPSDRCCGWGVAGPAPPRGEVFGLIAHTRRGLGFHPNRDTEHMIRAAGLLSSGHAAGARQMLPR